jgi:hypothetical protein
MKLKQKYINELDTSLINVKTTYNPFQIVSNSADVSPSDGDDLSNYGIIYVGTGGAIKFDLAGSGTMTITVEDGTFIPMIVKKVYATGTDADDISVLW